MDRRKEIYKEMDDYIGFLRKSESPEDSRFSIFKKLKRKKKEKIEPKPEFTEIPVTEEETKIEEVPEEIEKEKKIGFMTFMANLFRKKEEEKIEEDQEESVKLQLYKTQMQNDAKKALQIADELIKKIPNFELRKFTQSKDYETYESVMRKYGLR